VYIRNRPGACLGVLTCVMATHCTASNQVNTGSSTPGVDAALADAMGASVDAGAPSTLGEASGPITDATGGWDASWTDVDASRSGPDANPTGPEAGAGGRDLSTDPTKFFGDSRCAAAHVQLCEGFETGSLDQALWTAQGTAPTIDGLQHARGTRALHVTLSGSGLSSIRETKTFPEANNGYYGRIFVFFKSLPAAPMPYAHWTILAASGTGVSGEIRVSGQLQNGANIFGVGTDNRTPTGTGDWTNSDADPNPPVPVPLNTWLCVEWVHKGDTNETRFYWDGVEHPSLYTSLMKHGGNTNPYRLPTFTSLWFGWQEYQPSSQTFELWIDEIAIDAQRIGCVL
jgi:hypothetical protein